MSGEPHGMRTPLARVRGHGAAREGTIQFWRVRVTGLALLALMLVLTVLGLGMIGRDFTEARDLVGHPVVAALLIAFIALGAYHMKLGMQEIIEDYVYAPGTKLFARLANSLVCIAAGLAGTLAVLLIAFGA